MWTARGCLVKFCSKLILIWNSVPSVAYNYCCHYQGHTIHQLQQLQNLSHDLSHELALTPQTSNHIHLIPITSLLHIHTSNLCSLWNIPCEAFQCITNDGAKVLLLCACYSGFDSSCFAVKFALACSNLFVDHVNNWLCIRFQFHPVSDSRSYQVLVVG